MIDARRHARILPNWTAPIRRQARQTSRRSRARTDQRQAVRPRRRGATSGDAGDDARLTQRESRELTTQSQARPVRLRWRERFRCLRGVMRHLLIFLPALALPISACAKSDAGDSVRRASLPASSAAAEPDYSEWNRLLATYYDPARGMNYAGLKASDLAGGHERWCRTERQQGRRSRS